MRTGGQRKLPVAAVRIIIQPDCRPVGGIDNAVCRRRGVIKRQNAAVERKAVGFGARVVIEIHRPLLVNGDQTVCRAEHTGGISINCNGGCAVSAGNGGRPLIGVCLIQFQRAVSRGGRIQHGQLP